MSDYYVQSQQSAKAQTANDIMTQQLLLSFFLIQFGCNAKIPTSDEKKLFVGSHMLYAAAHIALRKTMIITCFVFRCFNGIKAVQCYRNNWLKKLNRLGLWPLFMHYYLNASSLWFILLSLSFCWSHFQRRHTGVVAADAARWIIKWNGKRLDNVTKTFIAVLLP